MNIEDDDKLPRPGSQPEPESAAAPPDQAALEDNGAEPAPARRKPELTRPRRSLVLLNMFLSLVLFATVAWLLLEQQQNIDGLSSRVAGVMEEVQDNAGATQAIEDLQNRLASAEELLADAGLKIEEQNEQLVLNSRQLQVQRDQLAALRQQLDGQTAQVQRLDEELVNTRLQLSSASSPVADINQSWLLGEAESLVRLAGQQLAVARDVEAAVSLLNSADAVLERISSAAVPPVRDALAADLGALQALPAFDPEALHGRLEDLSERALRLPLARLPAETETPRPEADSGERGWLDALREAAAEFITVRRMDEPIRPLLSTEDGYYLKQNLSLLLEQASLALLGRQGDVYADSLTRARALIEQFLGEAGGEKQAILDSLDELLAARLTRELPDVSATLAAFRQVLSGSEAGAEEP